MTEYGIRELKRKVKENEIISIKERNYIIKALEEVQQYRTIGTVSEFAELKEKATAKKLTIKKINNVIFYICPNCGKVATNSILKERPNCCIVCGTSFDWSEGKE